MDNPFRHFLFLMALLFVVLSSGSLQCAVRCYDTSYHLSGNLATAIDCHPQYPSSLTALDTPAFCHHFDHRAEAAPQSQLFPGFGGQILAWSGGSRELSPDFKPRPLFFTPLFEPIRMVAVRAAAPVLRSYLQLRCDVLLM